MAFNKFFSRLFGGSRDEDEIEELEDESEGQTPQAEPEDDLSDTVLTLSQEHPLFRLWSFRKGHTGWMPPPPSAAVRAARQAQASERRGADKGALPPADGY